MKFNFGFGKDPEVVGLEKEIAKTEQHSGSKKEENLNKEEGKRFGNPYGENNYNLPGHEDEERLRGDSHSSLHEKAFVPIEDVADESGLGDFENQDLSFGPKSKAENSHEHEKDDFRKRAKNKLDKTEYNALFSFIDSAVKSGTWKDYMSGKDEAPARSMPRDIAYLIKKVNDDGNKMVESLENTYNDNGYVTDERIDRVPVNSIKFKAPRREDSAGLGPKKILKKVN